MNSVQHYKRE